VSPFSRGKLVFIKVLCAFPNTTIIRWQLFSSIFRQRISVVLVQLTFYSFIDQIALNLKSEKKKKQKRIHLTKTKVIVPCDKTFKEIFSFSH
jgi:hypothetical protein